MQSTAEVANADLRLLGGASFERSMADFQAAINRLGFPGGELAALARFTLFVEIFETYTNTLALPRRCNMVQGGHLMPVLANPGTVAH